jgi:hypothetical protein
MDIVKNWKVFGLEDSVRASKYPMAVDVDDVTFGITDTVRNLASAPKGSGHDQFLTGIVVQFDLTFSTKAWVEAERYHFFDFVSSQSTMHRITRLDPAKHCNEYVDHRTIAILREKIDAYNANPCIENYLYVLYNIPTGFRLTARMTTNYRQLKTIYSQRKNHRLPEWREFCKWVEGLPHSYFITGGNKNEGI